MVLDDIRYKTDDKCKRKVCVYRFGFSPEQLL